MLSLTDGHMMLGRIFCSRAQLRPTLIRQGHSDQRVAMQGRLVEDLAFPVVRISTF